MIFIKFNIMKTTFIKYFSTLFILFVSLSTYAQKQFVVDPDAVVREVTGSFSSIKVSSGINVFISEAEKEVVAISGSDTKYREGIKTEITNGILHVFFKGEKIRYNTNFRLNVYIGYKRLEQLQLSGASKLVIAGVLEQPMLNIQLSGASELKGQIKAGDLNIKLSGASIAKVTGTVNNLNIESSGASDVKAYDLSAENCNVRASGASDVNVTVIKEIAANASGASNVYYKGTAELKSKQATGASSIARVQ